MKVGVKHMLSRLPDLVMDRSIDHDKRIVRLSMQHLDSALLATYVAEVLPEETGLRLVEDEAVPSSSSGYRLVVELGGQEFEARVVKLLSGSLTVHVGRRRQAGFLAGRINIEGCEEPLPESVIRSFEGEG